MKQQLTNVEIAKIVAMYFGQRISTYNGYGLDIVADNLNEAVNRKWKLLLTPLSEITDEHAIEVAKIHKHDVIKKHYSDDDLRNYLIMQGKRIAIKMYEEDYRVYLYLVQQGYAVPLFISLNHPCNGKDAIELGIAIEK
jgi:hypothetical protein